MAKQTINIGAVAGDGTGDPLRTAFTKANDNFTELYTDVLAATNSAATANSTAAAKLSPNGDGSALTGLTKTQVGLANVDNTSDANKPISTATQTALDLKLAITGNGSSLTGLTKSQVGLPNVDNTSDANKPVSTAQQAALDGKQNLDATLTALAGATWTAGTQVVSLTAADTVTLRTVGQDAGNLLDKTAGDALYAVIAHNHDSAYAVKSGVIVDATTARTLGLGDAGQIIRCTSGAPVTITLPLDATAAIQLGSEIVINQNGAGLVSFVADGAAVIEKRASTLDSLGQHSAITARKVAANTWLLTGDLA